ncbi:MAG: polysaccharide biosynthesis tyrosine autokinase [Nitrospirae bacterium]|nr:polysaccharide biosynthesis tyrosine autokinase [Nitrospirota bacterium]
MPRSPATKDPHTAWPERSLYAPPVNPPAPPVPPTPRPHEHHASLPDVLKIILKRKHIVILTVTVSFIVSLAFIRSQEPVFRTRSSVELDQFFTMAPGGRGYSWTDTKTEGYIVTSVPVVMEVARRLGRIPPDSTEESISAHQEHLRAVKEIQSKIRVIERPGTMIMDIEVTAADAKEARDIANFTAEAYRDHRNRRTRERADQAHSSSADQRKRLDGQLDQAERELADFKMSHRMMEAEASLNLQLRRLIDLEEREEALVERRKAVARILDTLLQEDYARGGTVPTLVFAGAPEDYEQHRADFVRTLSEKRELESSFTTAHPQVHSLGDRLRQDQEQLVLVLRRTLDDVGREEGEIADARGRLEASKLTVLEDQIQLVRLERNVERRQSMLDEMEKAWQTAQYEQSYTSDLVRVVELALVPAAASKRLQLTPMLSFLAFGFILGIGLAFLRESFDFSLDNVAEVEALVGHPVLSVIPHFDPEGAEARRVGRKRKEEGANPRPYYQDKMVAHFWPKDPVGESFRILRMGMRRGAVKHRAFLLTSATPQEGKSFITSNLAITFAQAGYPTLLVEANTRRPTMHKIFPMKPERGLTNIVLDGAPWKSLVRTVYDFFLEGLDPKTLQTTPGLDKLRILPAGPTPVHPSETLEQLMRGGLIETLKKEFEIVIVDCPPILPVADASVIAPHVDGLVLVYRIGRTPREMLLRAVESMKGAGANVLGLVLNDIDYHGPYFYPRYLYRYQYRGYTPEADARKPKRFRNPFARKKHGPKAPPPPPSELTALD